MSAVDPSAYLAAARRGATVDDLLRATSADGLNPIEAIKVLIQAFGLSLRDAKGALVEHPVWEREAKIMAAFEDAFFDGPDEDE